MCFSETEAFKNRIFIKYKILTKLSIDNNSNSDVALLSSYDLTRVKQCPPRPNKCELFKTSSFDYLQNEHPMSLLSFQQSKVSSVIYV